MKINYAVVGVFVLSAVLLFSIGLFLIGNRHKAFSHHVDFFTALNNVNGLSPGSKVRVSGFEAGQVTSIEIPDRPSAKFRLKLHVDNKLHNLVRNNSFVTVESDGLVGDKFVLIHEGSDQEQEAISGATLPAKEPIELSAVIAKMIGVMDQANAAIGDIKTKADGTLDAITTTVNNANGIVTGVRSGKGTVGMLLDDQQTATAVKNAVGNAQEAAVNLNQVTVQVKQVMADFQSRDLFGKAEATLNNTKDALKHEFFFRGFFKKRGFYSLKEVTPDQYRSNPYFNSQRNRRAWLNAAAAFGKDSNGNEVLSAAGEQEINQIIGTAKDSVIGQQIVVEGYSNQPSAADEIAASRSRSLIIAHYLEKRFHLSAKNIGLMPLNATAPPSSGKDSWDGACIVLLAGTPGTR
jgi:phospholipid/cholesterol/gamma-HCH transport system substrate-binding protein